MSSGVEMLRVMASAGEAPSCSSYVPQVHWKACRMMSRVWSTTPRTSSFELEEAHLHEDGPEALAGGGARPASSICRSVIAPRLSSIGPRRWSGFEDRRRRGCPSSTVIVMRSPARSSRRRPVQRAALELLHDLEDVALVEASLALHARLRRPAALLDEGGRQQGHERSRGGRSGGTAARSPSPGAPPRCAGR